MRGKVAERAQPSLAACGPGQDGNRRLSPGGPAGDSAPAPPAREKLPDLPPHHALSAKFRGNNKKSELQRWTVNGLISRHLLGIYNILWPSAREDTGQERTPLKLHNVLGKSAGGPHFMTRQGRHAALQPGVSRAGWRGQKGISVLSRDPVLD